LLRGVDNEGFHADVSQGAVPANHRV
jgi:hypothetical protein